MTRACWEIAEGIPLVLSSPINFLIASAYQFIEFVKGKYNSQRIVDVL